MTIALSLASKSSIWESAYLGMIASAIQVSTIGNVPINKKKLYKFSTNVVNDYFERLRYKGKFQVFIKLNLFQIIKTLFF